MENPALVRGRSIASTPTHRYRVAFSEGPILPSVNDSWHSCFLRSAAPFHTGYPTLPGERGRSIAHARTKDSLSLHEASASLGSVSIASTSVGKTEVARSKRVHDDINAKLT